MSEWNEYVLEDVIEKFIDYRGKTPQKTSFGIPLMTAKIIKGGRLLEPTEYIAQEEYSEWMTRGFPEINDILLTTEAPLGEVALVKDKNVALGQRISTLQTKKDLCDSIFLKYYLQSFEGQAILQSRASGSTVEGIKSAELKKIKISLPSIYEQKSIALILFNLDNKIDLLHRQNATLEKMAETLFRQWFVEEAKEEWEEVELGNLIDVVIDNRGKTPPTVEFETEYPLIEVNALNSQSCLVDYTVIRKYVTKETFDTWFRKHLKVNDIIISTVGTIGVFSIHLANKGCIAQNLVGLRSSRISSYFLYCFFKSNIETLINLDIGGVQPSIKVPHLLGLKIKLPPKDLLNEFNESVGIYFNKIAINQTQIRTLTALRDALLPKLMSGEVRVV